MYEELEFWKKHKEEKELQSKIAQEYGLFTINDNSFMLNDNSNESSDFTEFDEWMNDLIKRNGTTEY